MMSYFVSKNAITEQDMTGQPEWVEIDEGQYQEALEALLSGREVAVVNGAMVIRDPRPTEHHEWEDGEWVDRSPEPEPAPEPSLPPLTARQLRLGLVMGGITLAQVEAEIDAIEDEQDRAVAQIEWEYASQFERAHPLIEQIGAALGLTPEQIDAMWEAASHL